MRSWRELRASRAKKRVSRKKLDQPDVIITIKNLNMRGTTIAKRRERKINRVLYAVRNGMTYHEAERKFHIPKSTAWNRLNCTYADSIHSRRFALTLEEESLLVDFIIRYADRTVPLSHRYVSEAAGIVTQKMTDTRRIQLPFRNGTPG